MLEDRRVRVTTGLILAALVLVANFLAPSSIWFLLCLAVVFFAALEFVELVRHHAPSAPLRNLMVSLPLAAGGLFWLTRQGADVEFPGFLLLTIHGLILINATLATLLAGTEMRDAAVAMGILAFALPYFVLPVISLYWLQQKDPWLVLALLAIVALGDAAAYFMGSAFGRHKLAPKISPKKTWEGSIASFCVALMAAAAWSFWRLEDLRPAFLLVAALTSVAAQVGDLVESAIKRGAGVKDSSRILPGHGGLFDRLDATLLAAPIFVSGLWFLGIDALTPTP